jgi:hypothetical protein
MMPDMSARYLMVVLGLAACSTEDTHSNGVMTATINGVAWRTSQVTGTRTETTLSVGGQSTPFPVLSIGATGVVGPGTYPVTTNPFTAAQADFSILDSHGFALTYGGNGNGALVIASWSDAQAAGSFSFTAVQGSSVQNVSGTFTVTF